MEKELEIDVNNLNLEWLKQPTLYYEAAEALSIANSAKDQTKGSLEVMRASLDMEIRSDPERFKLSKVTETTVANAVILNDQYRATLKNYNQARFIADQAQNLVLALDQKKKSMESLVQLYIGQYFSIPKNPQYSEEVKEDNTNNNKDRLLKRRKR